MMGRCFPNTPTFVYFYADWCPDCVRSNPLVQDVFWKRGVKLQLLRVDIGDKAAYKDPENKMRALLRSKDWEVTCLPTLLYMGKGAKTAGPRLASDLEKCTDESKGRALIQEFVEKCTGGVEMVNREELGGEKPKDAFKKAATAAVEPSVLDEETTGSSTTEIHKECPFPFILLHDPARAWEAHKPKVLALGMALLVLIVAMFIKLR